MDREGMDPPMHQVTKRGVDHALTLHPALAGEGRAFDVEAEMTFAGRIMPAVTAVFLAVVDQFDPCRRKRRDEAREHFSRDRSGSLVRHHYYIVGFNGDKAIQDARTGRRGEGALRGPRLRQSGRVQGAAPAR